MTPTLSLAVNTRVWVYVDRNPAALVEPGWPIYEGVVRGAHEGKVLVDVPALGGQDPYPPQDVYLSRAAALLPLLERDLEEAKGRLRRQQAAVAKQQILVEEAEVQVAAARIELASAPGSELPDEPRGPTSPPPPPRGKRGRAARATRKAKTK